jgi:membrane associated rhomboid family serine protease
VTFIPIRDEHPTKIDPFVTIGLIAIMSLAFLWKVMLAPAEQELLIESFGLVPKTLFGLDELAEGQSAVLPLLTLLTSMFVHGDLFHLGANALYLWIFGNNVEDAMGHSRFFFFFILSGIIAATTHAMIVPQSDIPMIGASGAISGVLGAYLVLHPFSRILMLLFPFVVRVPAWVVLLTWFIGQGASAALADPSAGGVAWWAHIGGFIAGLILVFPFYRPKQSEERPRGPWER